MKRLDVLFTLYTTKMYIGTNVYWFDGPLCCPVVLFKDVRPKFSTTYFLTNFSHNQIIKIEDDLLSFGDRTHVKIARF